jgi:ankyrin repeat protein
MGRRKFKYPQPTKADLKLIRAAREGEVDVCLEAIDEGARIDAVNHHYSTPLGMAAQSSSIEIVRMLLERGADPNLLQGGKTPLMEAAYRCNREIIDMLISAGADIEAKAQLAPGQYIDVPYMAQNQDRRLGVELRSLINQQKKIKDGKVLLLRDVAEQLNLDEDGKPKGVQSAQ